MVLRANERKDLISRAVLMSEVQTAILPATIDDLTLDSGGAVLNELLPDGEIPYLDDLTFV